MADYEFAIPLQKDELLESHVGQYHIEDIVQQRNLQTKLQEGLRSFNSNGVEFILEHFDTYFSVLVYGVKLEWPLINKGYDHINQGCQALNSYLEPIFREKEISEGTRNKALNCTKMLLYIFTNIMKVKDAKLTADNATKLTLGKKGRKGVQSDESTEWTENDKHGSLVTLYNALQLTLNRLWDPPLAEQNFVDMIAQPCYKMMEDHIIKNKTVRETIFQILGLLNKKYNHGMSCPIKIVQILQLYEHAVSPICAGIKQMSEEYGLTTLGPQLAREIAEGLSTEEGSVAEGPFARNCGQFLMELTRELPGQMATAVRSLQCNLETDESYFLRISVLGMMCEILCTQLKGEQLTEDQRTQRDDFLDDLEEHMHDLSAHVRSKVLQYWCRMQREESVPVVRQKSVLRRAAGRLKDKAVLVRKAAMQLLKIFLEFNPFSSRLSLENLEAQLKDERATLNEIRAQADPGPDPELIKKWEKMEKAIKETVEKHMEDLTQDEPISQRSVDDAYTAIRDELRGKNYSRALALVRHAEREYPEAKLMRADMEKDDQVVYFVSLLRNVFVTANPRNSIQHCENSEALYKKIEEKEVAVGFLEEAVSFCRTMSEAILIIDKLLMSKQISDVTEAIEFFTAAHQFQIETAKKGVSTMLLLVWSPDQEKRTAVEKAYRDMYLAPEIRVERTRAYTIAKNLTKLLETTDRSSALALEFLLKKWTESEDISSAVIQILWELFSRKIEGSTESESLTALNLLVMISKAKPSVTSANLEAIQSIGFTHNYQTLSKSVELLLPLSTTKNRYPMDYPLLERLHTKLVETFLTANKFASFASSAIDVIYGICEVPDKMCIILLAELWKKMTKGTDDNGDQMKSYPIEYLTRFIFLLGHIAMQQLIYLDVTVYAELRRRNEVREQRKAEEKEANKINKKQKGKKPRKSVVLKALDRMDNSHLNISGSSTLSASARIRNQSIHNNTKSADVTISSMAEEDVACLEGAVADDADAEFIRNVCENHIVSVDTALHKYTALIKSVLMSPNKYRNEELQAAAALTLGRFMLVSSSFCEDHMQLLMTVLKRSTNEHVRSNIIITLTDLTLRFPNVIQPWNQHIYERLLDESVAVRQCTVKMVSYLVLHEMIRVKGQISDMALCCVDPDQVVSTMAKLFFKQLSQKGNSLYNVMPDIISRLSDRQLNIAEDDFRKILKYIMSLIQKDRQMEALVEKLCHRLKLSTDERQWRDLAFCLSLFNYNERSIRKLIENFDCYKEKLYCKSVYDSFKTLMTNASKMAKADLKAIVSELNDKIEDGFNINEEEQAEQGSPANRPRPRTTQKGKSAAKRKPRRKQNNSSDSDSDTEAKTPGNKRPPTTPSTRVSARKRTGRVIYQNRDSDSSDEDLGGIQPIEEEEGEKEIFKKPTQPRVGRKKK